MMERWSIGAGLRARINDHSFTTTEQKTLSRHVKGKRCSVKDCESLMIFGTFWNAALPSLWYRVAFTSSDSQRGYIVVLRLEDSFSPSLITSVVC